MGSRSAAGNPACPPEDRRVLGRSVRGGRSRRPHAASEGIHPARLRLPGAARTARTQPRAPAGRRAGRTPRPAGQGRRGGASARGPEGDVVVPGRSVGEQVRGDPGSPRGGERRPDHPRGRDDAPRPRSPRRRPRTSAPARPRRCRCSRQPRARASARSPAASRSRRPPPAGRRRSASLSAGSGLRRAWQVARAGGTRPGGRGDHACRPALGPGARGALSEDRREIADTGEARPVRPDADGGASGSDPPGRPPRTPRRSTRRKERRRRGESNPLMAVLQTAAFPFRHVAATGARELARPGRQRRRRPRAGALASQSG